MLVAPDTTLLRCAGRQHHRVAVWCFKMLWVDGRGQDVQQEAGL